MIYVLTLNDMRFEKYEDLVDVAWSTSIDALVDLLLDQRVDTYKDGRFAKSFRKGGPLEWYNVPNVPIIGKELLEATHGKIRKCVSEDEAAERERKFHQEWLARMPCGQVESPEAPCG